MNMLCKWEELPEFMRIPEIKDYYKRLSKRRLSLVIKRTFDFIMSTIMLMIFAPIFLCLSVWIKLDSPGSVFYRQKRVTQYGKVFNIYKFRTMIQDADKLGKLVTVNEDKRITNVGKYLRKYRLDELPQLINIWKGEMTFVGTRPEVVKYVKKYTKEMYATLLLPAGVTSEASIQYKNEDKFLNETNNIEQFYIQKILPDKMLYNLESIKNFTLLKDFKLIIMTIIAVLSQK